MSEVIIIGGGPAGLNCAYYLAKSGKDVILLEKHAFPVDKLCAGGLTVKDFGELPKDIIERAFVTQIIHTPLGKTTFKTSKPLIFTVNRKVLNKWLFERAKKVGAKIEKEKVIKINGNTIITKNGRQYNYCYLVGADGSTSIVRRHLNIPTKYSFIAWQTSLPFPLKDIEWFLDANIFGFGYGWIFPHKKSTVVGFICSNPKNAFKAKTGFLHWLKKTHALVINSPFKPYLINTDYRGHHFGRIFLAGDAAGLASGLTGEGIYFALRSGRSIAQMILSKSNGQNLYNNLLKVKYRHQKAARALNCLPLPVLNTFFECFRKGLKIPFCRELIFKRYG